MNTKTGTAITYCPCGQISVGISRGEQVCERCKRIEAIFERAGATNFARITAQDIADRIKRHSEDLWAKAHPWLKPVPPPAVPEGKVLISGYAHYIL